MDFREAKKRLLESPSVREEYERLIPEYQIIREILSGRIEKHYSQQKLADLTGIDRADISRLENGNANPSLSTIERIASALGKRVDIKFYDVNQDLIPEWVSPNKDVLDRIIGYYLQGNITRLVGNPALDVSEEKTIENSEWSMIAEEKCKGEEEWVEVA